MARWEFKLPDVGEGIAEGEIVAWLVKPGDVVSEDQPIVEVMTDKATVTITAPRAGVVTETRGRVGEVVAVHSVLVVFDVSGSAGHAGAPAVQAPTRGDAATPTSVNGHGGDRGTDDRPAAAPSALALRARRVPSESSTSAPAHSEGAYYNLKPLATPATRKRARDMDVDLRRVPPTGPLGRVTTRDVEAFAGTGSGPEEHTHDAAVAAEVLAAEELSPAPSHADGRRELEERIPYTGIRRKIGQKMAQSKATAAHFTFVEECDASALKALRERLLGPAEAMGVKLSFLPLVVKAVVASLKRHPALAATLDEANQEIVFRKDFNIGIATATPAGLMVPVVKRADRLSTIDVAREIERLASEARAGKSRLEDLQGSSFTITSLGAQGGLLATPIINYPEVAILGVHQMKQKPVVKAGQIVIGDVMILSLSFDHRVVDGHVGAAFAYEVIGYLEHPERLLLE